MHHYGLTVSWTGNQGSGTSSYRDYGRDHLVAAGGRPAIEGSADAVFHGDKTRWNPELELLAALSQCHMLSYLHVCAAGGVVVTSYEDAPAATMAETMDGGGHFTEVVLRPRVTVALADMTEAALRLHHEASAKCFIASSVNFPVRHEPVVTAAAPGGRASKLPGGARLALSGRGCNFFNMSELLPLFPLSTVLFPGMRLPLHIFEERYRKLAAYLQAQPEPRRFGVIAIRKGREVGPDGITALYDVGCVTTVRQIAVRPDGRFDLGTVGTERFRLLRVDDSLPYFQGEVELLTEEETPGETGAAEGSPGAELLALTTRRVQESFRSYLNALADRGGGVIGVADLPDEPVLLSYVVGASMIIDLPERQSLLAARTALDRLRLERSLLVRETAMLRATTSRPAPDYSYQKFSQN